MYEPLFRSYINCRKNNTLVAHIRKLYLQVNDNSIYGLTPKKYNMNKTKIKKVSQMIATQLSANHKPVKREPNIKQIEDPQTTAAGTFHSYKNYTVKNCGRWCGKVMVCMCREYTLIIIINSFFLGVHQRKSLYSNFVCVVVCSCCLGGLLLFHCL